MPAQMTAFSILVGAAALCAAAFARPALAAPEAIAAEGPKVAADVAVAPKPVVGAEDQGPDDFALRYYAALNQTARVNAEISRLQRLYPGYEPPADLYSAPAAGGVDEEPLWELFSADHIEELRAAISAKQRELVNWKPSQDLMQKLHRKELRKKISAYWADGRWQDLVDFIKSEDMSGLDQDVDILWTIAEAFARTKQTEDAVNVYKSILSTSKDRQVRVATIQKSMGSLRMNEVEKLLAAAPEGANDYASIMIDITRARIAAFLHDERAEEVPPADLAQFESYAKESHEANQLGLVAWYDYKRRDFINGLEWFKAAIQNGGDAMIAHGLAHTLRALEMLRDSEEVAYAWHEPLVNNVILFIDLLERDLTRQVPPFIEQERLSRYAKVTMESASGEGAQALGWYAYNSCQWDVALYWFERGLAWFPKDATAYGYALTLRRLKKDKEFFEVANRYDGLHSKVIEILFPDGYYHPPTPCDQKGADKLHGKAVKTALYYAPGPALIPGALPNYDPNGYTPIEAQKNSSAPVGQQVSQDVLRERALKTIKGKFPAAVATENPFRFRPIAMPNAPRGLAFAPPLAESPLAADPARGPTPLVARRAPGIGAMPYENYGFSLLPGWNGVETATWPPASHQVAPAGTQWAGQEADPAKAGLQALSSGQNNIYGRGPAAPAAQAPYAGPRSTPAQQPSYAAPAQRPAPAYGQYQPPGSR